MSGFKRDSGKNYSNKSASNSSSPITPRSDNRNSNNNNSGGTRYSKPSGGSRGGSSGSKNFMKIGDLTTPRSLEEKDRELADMITENLRGSQVRQNIKVYLPEGVNELVLRPGDMLSVSFSVHEKAPAFVNGSLTLITDK